MGFFNKENIKQGVKKLGTTAYNNLKLNLKDMKDKPKEDLFSLKL